MKVGYQCSLYSRGIMYVLLMCKEFPNDLKEWKQNQINVLNLGYSHLLPQLNLIDDDHIKFSITSLFGFTLYNFKLFFFLDMF